MIARNLRWLVLLPLLGSAPSLAETCPEKAVAKRAAKTPPGWVMDFDYRSDPTTYLRSRYEAARSENLRLYAYLYADWCEPCRTMRATIANSTALQALFDGTRVLMLNHDAYNCLASELLGRTVYPVRLVPVLVKVNADGSFGAATIPSRYIEHGTKAATIRHIRKFLESTAE